MPSLFSGVVPPMVSPLDLNERVDLPAVDRVVNRLIDDGVDGLFLLGSGGEGPTLIEADREKLVERACQTAGGRVQIMVGCLATSTARAIKDARMAARHGADAVVVTTSYYFGVPSQEGVAAHMLGVADASPLPMLMYNIPQLTHNLIEPETALACAEHANIVGMKDSSGNLEAVKQVIENKPEGFAVFEGSEQHTLESLAAGVDGLVNGCNNVLSKGTVELWRAWQAGDIETARRIQDVDMELLHQVYAQGYWLSTVKCALDLLGVCGPTVMRPIPSATAAQRVRVQAALTELGLL